MTRLPRKIPTLVISGPVSHPVSTYASLSNIPVPPIRYSGCRILYSVKGDNCVAFLSILSNTKAAKNRFCSLRQIARSSRIVSLSKNRNRSVRKHWNRKIVWRSCCVYGMVPLRILSAHWMVPRTIPWPHLAWSSMQKQTTPPWWHTRLSYLQHMGQWLDQRLDSRQIRLGIVTADEEAFIRVQNFVYLTASIRWTGGTVEERVRFLQNKRRLLGLRYSRFFIVKTVPYPKNFR